MKITLNPCKIFTINPWENLPQKAFKTENLLQRKLKRKSTRNMKGGHFKH